MNNFDSANSNFDKIVEQVAVNWMPEIIEFLEELYKDKWLPSHDISHHKRVWCNAVELSRSIFASGQYPKLTFLDELFICCFFHDTGLLIDPGEFHGKESKLLADRFLSTTKQKVISDRTALLEAIEKHDDKNYQTADINSNLLLEILSLADDIDAFGAIGLYRYIEIYLVRGIEPEKIPEVILSNVQKRYDHLVDKLEKHNIKTFPPTEKYHTLVNLLEANTFSDSPVSLVNWINETIVEPKRNPEMVLKSSDSSVKKFNRIESFKNIFCIELSVLKMS